MTKKKDAAEAAETEAKADAPQTEQDQAQPAPAPDARDMSSDVRTPPVGAPVQYRAAGAAHPVAAIVTSIKGPGRVSLVLFRHEYGNLQWITDAGEGENEGEWTVPRAA